MVYANSTNSNYDEIYLIINDFLNYKDAIKAASSKENQNCFHLSIMTNPQSFKLVVKIIIV